MRLIDADALKGRAIRVSTVKEHCYMKAVGKHEIDKAPTIDAVPVVRCRDCYWWNKERAGLNGECVCNRFSVHKIIETFTTPDHFCACGERRKYGN